jgi:hypothetical protein
MASSHLDWIVRSPFCNLVFDVILQLILGFCWHYIILNKPDVTSHVLEFSHC